MKTVLTRLPAFVCLISITFFFFIQAFSSYQVHLMDPFRYIGYTWVLPFINYHPSQIITTNGTNAPPPVCLKGANYFWIKIRGFVCGLTLVQHGTLLNNPDEWRGSSGVHRVKRWTLRPPRSKEITVCPRSSYSFYIVSYYIIWVTTSWTYSSYFF